MTPYGIQKSSYHDIAIPVFQFSFESDKNISHLCISQLSSRSIDSKSLRKLLVPLPTRQQQQFPFLPLPTNYSSTNESIFHRIDNTGTPPLLALQQSCSCLYSGQNSDRIPPTVATTISRIDSTAMVPCGGHDRGNRSSIIHESRRD